MTMKKISTLSVVAAVGLIASSSSFAATIDGASACFEQAIDDAAYVLTAVRDSYADGYTDNELANIETAYHGFTRGGGTASTAKSGLVYSYFGKQNADANGNYIFVAYLGANCGPATGTKMFCNLNQGGTAFNGGTTVTSAKGFSMECKLCTGVRLAAGSPQEEAYNTAGSYDTDVLTTAAQGLTSIMGTANTQGIALASTPTEAWASGTTCHEAPWDTSS